MMRWLAARPAAQLVIGAVLLAFLFPATPVAAVCRLICYAALGIGAAAGWRKVPPRWLPSPLAWKRIVIGGIALLGVIVFWDLLWDTPDWQLGDWGPQHAVLARIMPSLPGLDVPVWNHAVSTGDAPLELYPALTYLFTGHVAWLFGLENDIPHAFMIVAMLVHVALAVLTTAIALRVASRPVAAVIGALVLVDSGAISHGGTVGLFHWAILHSSFAHVFSLIAALGVLAALRRPRIGASVAIWVGVAVSTAAHPAALITAAAYILALAVVALLAADVPPRRALVAIGHVALGMLLGACVWLPASERLIDYGQHFPNELFTPTRLMEMLFAYTMPISAYGIVVFAGHLGIITAPWSRRADAIFIALVALVMLVGLADAPYLSLGLAPSQAVARLGAIRMMLLARPFVFAMGGFVITTMLAHVRVAWIGAPQRARWIAAAVLGIVACSLGRVVPEWWRAETQRAVGEAETYAGDPVGRAALVQWARAEMTHEGPDAFARALFEEDTHEHLHLTAITGLPTFHMTPQPDLLLRERIENVMPESLQRFDVKWIVGVGRSPTLGDPASELVLGTYHIRTLPAWDGQFARVERGYGKVRTTRLDDRAVEVVVDAPGPILVALGTGYYPRWRATHESGLDEPVYALPATQGGTLHVVSAWLKPGRTTFTCDGPLPSDGDGRILSLLAAAIALAALVVWRRPAWRISALRRLARARAYARGRAATIVEFSIPAILAIMTVRGCYAQTGRAQAVLVGTGVRASAKVEARVAGGAWQTCGYSPVTANYRCDDVVTVSDTTTNVLNDALPSWAFITPAIGAYADTDNVEIRITRDLDLSGRYWAGASSGTADIQREGEAPRTITARQQLDFTEGSRTTTITARVPDSGTLYITIVAQETLVPDRTFLAPPPVFPHM